MEKQRSLISELMFTSLIISFPLATNKAVDCDANGIPHTTEGCLGEKNVEVINTSLQVTTNLSLAVI
jgi:hypothetical protein